MGAGQVYNAFHRACWPWNQVITGKVMLREVCGIHVMDQFDDMIRRLKGGRAESTSPLPLIETQT